MKGTRINKNHRAGTTLIEILVVIVVFLVGILAIVQVFPGGFKLLNNSRDLSVADSLARDMIESYKGRQDLLPLGILPETTGAATFDPSRSLFDTSIFDQTNVSLNLDGSFVYGGNTYGDYSLFTGPNVFRRIVGEGLEIPAPRAVGGFYGSLAMLALGPPRSVGATTPPLDVYADADDVTVGTPPTGVIAYGQTFLSSTSDPNATIAIEDASGTGTYRISLSYTGSNGGTTVQRRVVNALVTTGEGGTSLTNGYLVVPISLLAVQAGDTVVSIDPRSLQVQREFEQLAEGAAFSNTDPYQFENISPAYGGLLFNPLSYNFRILKADGRQMPLIARVDYDVEDWSILSDVVRLQSNQEIYRLSMRNLELLGHNRADGLKYTGIGLPDFNGSAIINSDIVFVDASNGAIIAYDPTNSSNASVSSIYVDKSAGWFRLNPIYQGTVPTLLEWLPAAGSTTGFQSAPVSVNVDGLVIRAYYRANGGWARVPYVTPSTYSQVSGTPGIAEYEVGSGTRIYFPQTDATKRVVIDAIYYSNGTSVQKIEGQSFVIHDKPSDANGPYVDIRDYDSNAVALDFSHGYAVSGVHGNSFSVTVWSNPEVFSINTDSATSLNAFDRYRENWRRTTLEEAMQQGTSS